MAARGGGDSPPGPRSASLADVGIELEGVDGTSDQVAQGSVDQLMLLNHRFARKFTAGDFGFEVVATASEVGDYGGAAGDTGFDELFHLVGGHDSFCRGPVPRDQDSFLIPALEPGTIWGCL